MARANKKTKRLAPKKPKKKRYFCPQNPLSIIEPTTSNYAITPANAHNVLKENAVNRKNERKKDLPCTSNMATSLRSAKMKRLALKRLQKKANRKKRRKEKLQTDSRNRNSTPLRGSKIPKMPKMPKNKMIHHETNAMDGARPAAPERNVNDSMEGLIIQKYNLIQELANISVESTETPNAAARFKSREEGEIVTDDETKRRVIEANVDDTDDDDDCVLVENKIEEIVVDDTELEPVYYEDITGDISQEALIDLTPKANRSVEKSKSNQNSLNLMADEVIVLDDTVEVQERATTSCNREITSNHSVVFVSESWPDFIPLTSNNVAKPIKEPDESNTVPRIMKSRNSLFSASEKRELEAYNVNAYNPNSIAQKELRKQNPKRMVIIDGSNVAYSHSRKQTFSVKGLQICVEHFKRMGHEVKAVIPLFRTHSMKSSNPAALQQMHKEGIVVLTPCKNLPGLSSSSYDDRFILQLASELDAAIVSNDNYRDLIHENSAFKKLIENRVIGYTWCDDVFILPKDPYGKFGPTLHSILNRQV